MGLQPANPPHTPTVVLVGNPRPGSRTARVAEHVAAVVGRGGGLVEAPVDDVPGSIVSIDLADLGPAVLDQASEDADRAAEVVRAAHLLVVASPVYKGAATGLLKSFLDRFVPGALQGVVALPVMVGASPAHAHAVESSLRPVLVELGATCPVAGLYLQEQSLGAIGTAEDPVIAWFQAQGWALTATLDAASRRLQPV